MAKERGQILNFEFWIVDFGLGRLVLDSFRIQNFKLPFGGHRRAATKGVSTLVSQLSTLL
jgi:hypothetical protein